MKLAVFQTGVHTDMNGVSRRWSKADLDAIVKKYDPAAHEAPAVIGHPKTDAPAWAWVESLSRNGNLLIAQFKSLAPEFKGWLEDGRYKKRSICLYPDMTLKHVGFLGAQPPAVKGLPDYPFSEDANDIIIEFSEKENTMDLKEFFEGLKFWEAQKQTAQPLPAVLDTTASFSEADVAAAVKSAAENAAEAERTRLTLEFAEKEKQTAQNARSEAIKTGVTQLVAAGKIPPAWVKSGLVEFAAGLDGAVEIQFAESGEKLSRQAWFMKFLADLPRLVSFGEYASRDADASGDPAGKLDALIAKKMEADKSMSYSLAFTEVQKEHPDLVLEYRPV